MKLNDEWHSGSYGRIKRMKIIMAKLDTFNKDTKVEVAGEFEKHSFNE